jgi:hypothetical protein
MIGRWASLGRPHAAAAAIFVLLAVVHTWPLASNPAHLSRNDNGDVLLNEWIIAWVAHQLPRHPLQLFEGNIFYPAPDALAFSEPLIAPALLAAPALWLGASPVLAHNLLLLAGLVLTGLGTYAVAFAWTRDRLAALVAGSLFAFNAHTLTRLAHVQAMHAYGLPLALLFADRLIAAPGPGPALGLAASMTLLAYTSGYLAVFGAVMIAVVVVARLPDWRPTIAPVTAGFALATGVATILVLPMSLPYQRVAREQGMVRTLDVVREYSATVSVYLAAPGTIHHATWSNRFFGQPGDPFFPGVAALVLAGVAVWGAMRLRLQTSRVVMLAAVGLAGFVLSLGLQTPVYGWLFSVFPPVRGMRAAARFGVLLLLAVALLAGLGLAALRQRAAGRRWALGAAVLALGLVNLEALRAPFEYRWFEGIPRVYDLLAREPGRVVLAETPFYPPEAVFENAEYVLNSTAHWRPLMNGYSGYVPESYRKVAWTFWYFPEERAIDAMRAAGVTHVTVHTHRFGNEAAHTLDVLSRRPDVELLAISARRGVRLYRLR